MQVPWVSSSDSLAGTDKPRATITTVPSMARTLPEHESIVSLVVLLSHSHSFFIQWNARKQIVSILAPGLTFARMESAGLLPCNTVIQFFIQ